MVKPVVSWGLLPAAKREAIRAAPSTRPNSFLVAFPENFVALLHAHTSLQFLEALLKLCHPLRCPI